jgi:hypothetical protein
LYLDFERVRSLAAMVFGGVPEEIATVAEKRSRTATKGNIGIPLVGGAEVGGDLLYLRSEHETRALHHGLFRSTVRRLEELGRVEDVDESTGKFPEGKFVRLNCEVVVRDYLAISNALELATETWDVITKVEKVSSQAAQGSGRQRKRAVDQSQIETDRVMRKQLPAVRESIAALFGDAIRVYCVLGKKVYVGILDRNDMLEAPQPGLDPTTVGGIWSVLCDVSFGEGRGFDLTPALSQMEAVVEQLIATLKDVAKLTQPPATLAVRPIAIYREL